VALLPINGGMDRASAARRSTARLFGIYAAVTIVPVLILGVVLAITFRNDANRRGLAEGRSEAALIAQTAVEPELTGRPLGTGLTVAENVDMKRLVVRAVGGHDVLRLRLRTLGGVVVFSDDGSGLGASGDDDEALDAAHGEVVAQLTRLNADGNDTGASGVAAVEIYRPLTAGSPSRRVGVLEIYLPYAPIARDVDSGLHRLYLDLGIGLVGLYVLLFAITASVSRRLRREAAINAFLAQHDTLTELPNRVQFLSRAKAALARAERSGQLVAIAIIDLDHFKDINDTLGHRSGDQLLTELGRRISANMRPGDTVARLGGDEFALILCDVSDAEQALFRLRSVIAGEVEVRGLALAVTPSIGFELVTEANADVDTLLQHAEVAMYLAKEHHSGVVRYEPALDHFDPTNLSLVGELRRGIDAGELVLHYQPQLGIAGDQIQAVEALVRWQHPARGLLAPDRFLPLAEQTDLIDNLTEWVLRAALAETRSLREAGSDVTVAVNVSARNIARADFAAHVIGALRDADVPADRLVVEVTETALLIDPEHAARVLAELADAGVKISLDDFGRGQTSLGYLSALPFHELKIDRSFVTDMRQNGAHAAIVRSMIDLGHNLSMRVVAEGIETEDVLAELGAYGCDLAQGYLLARPMAVAPLQQWLTDRHARQVAAAAPPSL
jgi:diguanylate cyclase (GGDEF)-like protein